MANPWFRMYSEFASDPKVQMLSETDQRRFVMLLCLRCSNVSQPLQDDEVAFQLRISNEVWLQTKQVLMEKGLIDEESKPCAWDKRQYISDVSTRRVLKHREKKKRECNVSVTAPDTDADTEAQADSELKVAFPQQADEVLGVLEEKSKKGPSRRSSALSVADLVRDGVSEQAAVELLALRQQRKAPLMPLAWRAFQQEAQVLGWTMDQVVQECLARGWLGFKAQWVVNSSGGAQAGVVVAGTFNKQIALEQRNAAVAREWLVQQERKPVDLDEGIDRL